jgi:predicted dehydrogenase
MAADQAARSRLAVIGAGDVAHRRYLPALRALADRVEVVAVVDRREGVAEAAVASVADWSSEAKAHRDLDGVLRRDDVEAAINLTPGPVHGEVNQAILDAGLHLYTEKPLASSVKDANRLIESARRQDRLFLAAPGTAATRRFRWLNDLIAGGRFGAPTLVVAQYADPGPAAWREYTGDPTPFYRPGVGPVFDHGVYRLHEMTMLMGPVRRVQAMGAISSPTRRVRGGPLTGQTIEVATPDHILVNLEFARGGLGQLLASFGTPATQAPWLELHFPMATVSFRGESWDPGAPVSLYVDDDGPEAREGWQNDIEIPVDHIGVVETGVQHFVACLRGDAEPVLTAEHARHTLDVTLQAYASIADGRSHLTGTSF